MFLRICTVLTWLVTALPAPAWAQDQPQSSGDVAAVTPRAILYEEDANDPQGTRMIGSVVWRTEMETPGAGEPPELVVRADVEIPDRAMSMTWKLSRNTDPAGSASHIIDIVFELPQGFRSGGIANVPGILTKTGERSRGTALAGLSVKVAAGYFEIGLSAAPADKSSNVQLLKERSWLDIPILYTNNRRAILAMQKGSVGERVFREAFAAWSADEVDVSAVPPKAPPAPPPEPDPPAAEPAPSGP